MSEEQWGKKFSAILQKYVDVQNFLQKRNFPESGKYTLLLIPLMIMLGGVKLISSKLC